MHDNDENVQDFGEEPEEYVRTPNAFRIGKSYDTLRAEYFKAIRMAPNFVCVCCGGLFFKSAVTETSEDMLIKKGVSTEVIEKALCVQQNTKFLCITCKNNIHKNKVPRLCLRNGFDFPKIPPVLKVKLKSSCTYA